jgi:hypothetical protein
MFGISGHHVAKIKAFAIYKYSLLQGNIDCKEIKPEEIYFDTLTQIPSKEHVKVEFLPHKELNSVPTTKTSWIMLLRKIIVFYSENHRKLINIVCKKMQIFLTLKKAVRRVTTVL